MRGAFHVSRYSAEILTVFSWSDIRSHAYENKCVGRGGSPITNLWERSYPVHAERKYC